MPDALMPRYPIYIPSKGRADVCHTANMLRKDNVPFKLVVEPQEAERYLTLYGAADMLILPENNMKLIGSRNWIKTLSIANGDVRHWQLDDNIRATYRYFKGKRIYCHAGVALRVAEDFTDRYENVAISGLNYRMFIAGNSKHPPFVVNHRVYSCSLILNSIPHRWRIAYNDDTDICLQVLADGWCTILFNAFLVDKMWTMTVKGGNTSDLYQGDGRLKMARALERLWPGVVTTGRRFQRPQHKIADEWRRFDTPLKLKAGIDLAALPPNEYGMKLTQKRDTIKNDGLRALVEKSKDAK